MPPKHTNKNASLHLIPVKVDPLECPFREFKDHELSNDFWGMGPAAMRNAMIMPKSTGKQAVGFGILNQWEDEQVQPLPNSVRHYLHGWLPAEELAMSRWNSEVILYDENNLSKMSVMDYQLSHAQVLQRSSFCRRVLCACFNLERVEGLQVEHLWEQFNFIYGPEGWRAKYHIYSPGLKAGGGAQHRPTISKNGCYLVRLYYLGAWRCVWVSDQVPIDASGSPLLPFSPLSSPSPTKGKGTSPTITSPYVHLWPLLLCKALLKIAAPDMNEIIHTTEEMVTDEEDIQVEDGDMLYFDLMHTLTGGISLNYLATDNEHLWRILQAEVKAFYWDDDDDMQSSTVKSRSSKKGAAKDKDRDTKQKGLVILMIEDTKEVPTYVLPGITPAFEMSLIVTMARDIPLKRPLPEPEVPLWKQYRWVDWARSHGLYDIYECPRTRYLKVNGLMKSSNAPHLLDIQSTESLTRIFREEHNETEKKKTVKDLVKPPSQIQLQQQMKEEIREWVAYDSVFPFTTSVNIAYYPSSFEFASAASNPSPRAVKAHRNTDIPSPKAAPLYLQIDSPEENVLKMSLNMVHPRILENNGFLVDEYIERAYVFLESFEWFCDKELPNAAAYIQTRTYDSVEVKFPPGRYFFRMWVHSRMNWHAALLSESRLILGTRDVIQSAACLECHWVSKFLNTVGSAFSNWIRTPRSIINFMVIDQEFYLSYQPDLDWDPKIVGYEKPFVHWMFRQALQSLLYKRLHPAEFQSVCPVLRKFFCDPDIGFLPKPKPRPSLREIIEKDPCDCPLPEAEFVDEEEVQEKELRLPEAEEEPNLKPIVSDFTMAEILKEPQLPVISQLCEHATDDVPCGVLRVERAFMVKKHEAATCIQAHWRGFFARKCLTGSVILAPDIIKLLMDNAFGNLDVLSQLMNEFFLLFPATKYAYSISAALGGVYGIHQHAGVCPVTSKCKWIPYFQGVFYCHHPVKVHFDVHSTIEYSSVQIYDNDTGEICPQAYNAHITFDIHPNIYGYTVLGHGSFNVPLGHPSEVHWQLTVMTSIDNVFHVCESVVDSDTCSIMPLTPASKLHIEEFYIPNRRNILGGIQISVSRVEAVSFRAASTTPDLKIEAVLRTTNQDGEMIEVARCHGKGEIFWPYIRLKPASTSSANTLKNSSYALSGGLSQMSGMKGIKGKGKDKKFGATPAPGNKSVLKLVNLPKTYSIQVIAPDGWPLPIQQWKTISEVQQDVEIPKVEVPGKKPAKEKVSSAKDKTKNADAVSKEAEKMPTFNIRQPLPEDAYIEIECSTTLGGGAYARRDDDRDLLFATVTRSWALKEPGRNERGALIRQEFREEFLVPATPSKSETMSDMFEEMEKDIDKNIAIQHPTPVTESGLIEAEEVAESMYYDMPEQLKDRFIPLDYVPQCTKEKSGEDPVILTGDMAEAAKNERAMHLEAAIQRMKELTEWNTEHVLKRQHYRIGLLEKLLIDSTWSPELATIMDYRNDTIALYVLERQQSALKKKQAAVQSKADNKRK